jgi:hypothetical protein
VHNDMTGSYEVTLHKHIRRGWDSFSSFARVEVGDGLSYQVLT